jgi:hypothetical protein
MSDYVKTTDFLTKDALASGHPDKLVRGSELETEFDNIETAVATKEDAADKGAANGYAPLNASSDIDDTYLTSNVPLKNGNNVFTGTGVGATSPVTVSSAAPRFALNETDAAADNRLWELSANSEGLFMSAYNDARSSGTDFVAVQRTAHVVDSIALTATNVTVNGTNVRDAGILTSGTLADARVAESNVTQHEAALSLLLTQLGSAYETGSFTLTFTGLSTSPTTTCYYVRIGTLVTLSVPSSATGTSNATTFGASGLPASLRPATGSRMINFHGFQDNNSGQNLAGVVIISNSSNLAFHLMREPFAGEFAWNTGNWTNGNGKGFGPGFTCSYLTA